MTSPLHCVHGHTWELDAKHGDVAPTCPICGTRAVSAGEPETLALPPSAEPPTVAPNEPDNGATVAPGDSPRGASPGKTVPGYDILGELGRGGMGVVYQARHLKLDRIVALKMILAGGHAGAAELERFRVEAQAIARLQHPNIVQVFEVGEHEGLPFFSLEYCGGGTLKQKLAGTPLPPRGAAALVEILARAMHAAHEKGIIHRDLKPANILIPTTDDTDHTDKGPPGLSSVSSVLSVVKITDFGLAKKLDEAGRTATGAVMGTPSYMAPEQAGGKSKELGPACDVYALGAILYECLTGRPPFKAATALDTIMQVISAEPAPLRKLNTKVPRDLEVICLKCLRKEPSARYASARDLADDLDRFLAGEPIRARPPAILRQMGRWLAYHQALVVAYLFAMVAIVVHLLVAGVGGETVFGLGFADTSALSYAFLPLVGLVLAGVARPGLPLLPLLGALLLAVAVCCYLSGEGPQREPVLATAVAVPAALLLLPWRAGLATLLAAITAFGVCAGMELLIGGPRLLAAGILHGLLLGSLARVAAWALRRERGAAALGAVAGAYAGLVLADLHFVELHDVFIKIGAYSWTVSARAFYLEAGTAYLGAIAGALLGRRLGAGSRQAGTPANAGGLM